MGFLDLLDSSLIVGPLPAAVTGAGIVGMVLLVARRGRRWWTWWVPAGFGVAALSLAVLVGVVDGLWRPVPDPLPSRVPGGHTWPVASAVMDIALSRLAPRLGLSAVAAPPSRGSS